MKNMIVKVKCDYRMSTLIPPNEDTYWTARLKSPPLDRKANNECSTLLANYFGCTKSRFTIALGQSVLLKHIRIDAR